MLGFWAVIGIIIGVCIFPIFTLGVVLCCFGATGLGWILIIGDILYGYIKYKASE